MTPRSRKVCVGCRAGYFEKTVAFPFGRRRRQYSMEDMPMTFRLRFGVFLAPFHKPGINPTLALQNDLDLVAWLDRLGYDEAWFGEHHSAGTEISASPEIMIAVAAQRPRHIKLGTGVVSLSYHNPLWVAERIVLLDHLTRGRAMFDAGPGSLPTDGIMIGVPQSDGQSLSAQIAELKVAKCEKVFQEKISGARSDRKQLARLMAVLSKEDVLVVTRLDRLARSTRDLLNLLGTIAEKGAGFKSLRDTWADTTTAHGRLMLTVLGGLAEFERELIRMRTGGGPRAGKGQGGDP